MVKVRKVNAFTSSPDAGNPAGVVLNSPSLNPDQMKKVSKSLQVSETAFVFPSEKADFKIRFFTPNVEVDLCGHATIATFFTMALQGYFSSINKSQITQETRAGILPVDILFSDEKVDMVLMTQGKPVIEDVNLDISEIVDALNIRKSDIDDSFPRQRVSTGLFTFPICVDSFQILRDMNPDFEKIKEICRDIHVGSFHVFTFETIESNSIFHARNFAPTYGINEDPVTGTANGAVCSYLVKNNIISNDKMICEQGDIIGKAGRVYVEIDKDIVKVGGRATIVEDFDLSNII